jgi:hypothetical protein
MMAPLQLDKVKIQGGATRHAKMGMHHSVYQERK